MDVYDRLNSLENRENLCAFIDALRNEIKMNGQKWENVTLDDFLEAMSAWLKDIDGYYLHRGEELPANVPWRFFAQILLASAAYE